MRQASSTLLSILLALSACGEDSSSDDTGLLTTTLETSSETSGGSDDGDCTPGTPYCECFDDMCFEGLVCNEDDHCIPDAPPPMDATGGEDGADGDCTPGSLYCECGPLSECDAGLAYDWSTGDCICIVAPEQDECDYQYDCPYGEVCLAGDLTWCGSLELIDWQVSIEGWDISCSDGVGVCEYLFYKQRWNWDTEQWETTDFTNIQNPPSGDWLRVDAWEDDLFSNDYLNSFQMQVVDGVEAWKYGEAAVSYGDYGSDTMNLLFQPL